MRNLLAWNKSFEIGIPEIDKEHKYLVDTVSKLQAHQLDIKEEQLMLFFSGIYDFITYYLKKEEELMLSTGYEDYNEHKAEHSDFIKQMNMFYARFKKDRQQFIVINIIDFLKDWIIGHLLTSDKEFGVWYSQAGNAYSYEEIEELLAR